MAQKLWFLLGTTLTIISHHVPLPPHAAAAGDNNRAPSPLQAPRPDCPRKCGNVDVPYPYGISDGCSFPGSFKLLCDRSIDPPKLSFGGVVSMGGVEVVDITLESGEMRVLGPVASVCYTSASTTIPRKQYYLELSMTPFMVSATRNEFIAIGCNTLALLQGSSNYYTGCITSCASLDQAAHDGNECTGLGCCKTSIPGNLTRIGTNWNNDGKAIDNNPSWKFSPCSYALVAEKGWYRFQRRDLLRQGNETFSTRVRFKTIPMWLDWAVRSGGSCQIASEAGGVSVKPTAPTCLSANSYCVNVTQGSGYLCNCSKGYKGNPYVNGGCTNINECELRKSDPARYEKLYPCASGSTCHDTEGNYTCKCNFGRRGDGKTDKGCQPIFPGYAVAIVVTFVASVIACFLIMELKRQKQRRFFDKNGGQILKSVGINIFTEGQLKKITNGYSTPIGEGAFGKVFVGIIIDEAQSQQQVAVKRSTAKGEALPKEEFVNEITFQFQIRHKNVVRLVGCCLETDVPMLVFEFVPNGSLYDVLHRTDKARRALTLPERLDIALGSAEALAHMHSRDTHNNHVHGDVKSGNILLDEDLAPKVSDFGSSKLVSVANKLAKWCVSGHMNYIDPAYIRTGRFTEKSDVYSFGVVLLELITRKKAKYDENNSLPIDFIKSCKEEGNGRGMYDKDILTDKAQAGIYMECLHKVAALAVQCIKEDVDERPTMADVAEKLRQVKVIACEAGSS